MDMGWNNENLPMIDLPMSKVPNDISRSYFFSKEGAQDFWDHMVSILVSSRGIVILLYVGGRVLHSLISSRYRIIISIVETVHQEIFMNNFLSIIVFKEKYLYWCFQISDFIIF